MLIISCVFKKSHVNITIVFSILLLISLDITTYLLESLLSKGNLTIPHAGEMVGHWHRVSSAPSLENQPAVSWEVRHTPHYTLQFHSWDLSKIKKSILWQNVCKSVHSPFLHSCQTVNYKTQVPINRRTEKENTVVYLYTDSYLETMYWFTEYGQVWQAREPR